MFSSCFFASFIFAKINLSLQFNKVFDLKRVYMNFCIYMFIYILFLFFFEVYILVIIVYM